MINLDILSWLQKWYFQQCNGEWEHGYGIKINTIDNPGWRVKINLHDTVLAGKPLNRIKIERSDDNWVHYWVENSIFEAAGGPENLSEIFYLFKKWTENQLT